ncbi:MAG: 16S rRNA (guanine(966)-N(2))-methyltransferase RsmD [Myxococcota bacterium]
MRIIAGQWGGRRLPAAPQGVRPSSDRVKEALFSMLGPKLEDARILDLFAGTGALGLEALSRGAGHATFVERASRSWACIEQNLRLLQVSADRFRLVRGDAFSFLRRDPTETFDLVFVDPPYAELGKVSPCLEGRILAPDGQMIVEHDKRVRVETGPGLRPLDQRSYGDTRLSVFTRS